MRHSTQILLFVLFSLSLMTQTYAGRHRGGNPPPEPGSGSGSGSGSESGSGGNNLGAGTFHACDPKNRPQACTLEYLPVCSYVHNCEGGACTITSGNKCTACATANVDGYVEGACEDIRSVCDPKNRPQACPLNFVPTCAVKGNCQGSDCFEDASNDCVACSMKGVAYSLPGACPPHNRDERTYCDPQNRPVACTLDYTPVCAHVNHCRGGASCYFTAGNACSACGDHRVNWHTPGECDPAHSRTYCDPNNRPKICTADYTPVCAHKENCKGHHCFLTAANACGACTHANVDWHIPGECKKH